MSNKPKVGEILVAAGIIDKMQLDAALGEQSRWGHRLGITLIKMGMVEEDHLIRALARQLDLPVASLAGKRIPDDVIALVPSRVASQHGVIPLFTRKNGQTNQLFLGMEDPSNLGVLDDLTFRTGMEIHPVMVGPSELGQAIDRYYHGSASGPPTADPFRKADMMGTASLRVVTDDTPQPGTAPVSVPSVEPSVSRPPLEPSAPNSLDRKLAVPLEEKATPERVPEAAAPIIELSRPVAALPAGLAEDVEKAIAETEQTRIVAKAMAQLLIEKGLLSLEELQVQIAEVKAKSQSARSSSGESN